MKVHIYKLVNSAYNGVRTVIVRNKSYNVENLTTSGSGINFVSGCEFHGGFLLVQFSFSRGDFLPSGNPHVSGFVVGIFGGNVDLKMKI
jgi:hypothetical protein